MEDNGQEERSQSAEWDEVAAQQVIEQAKICLIQALTYLEAAKPTQRSITARYQAIAITELQKLLAFVRVYLP